jgi:FAD/FMN-containing dehydrogenase
LLLPRSTAEVSAICRICNAHNQSMVVHGGLTGLVGGTVSRPSDIVISLQRMNGTEEVDPSASARRVPHTSAAALQPMPAACG